MKKEKPFVANVGSSEEANYVKTTINDGKKSALPSRQSNVSQVDDYDGSLHELKIDEIPHLP
jgi:hypothetical protein